MRLSKLVKTSALFGLLGGILINLPSQAMMGDHQEDEATSGDENRSHRQAPVGSQRVETDEHALPPGFPSMADMFQDYLNLTGKRDPQDSDSAFVQRLRAGIQGMLSAPLAPTANYSQPSSAVRLEELVDDTSGPSAARNAPGQEEDPTSISLHPKILSEFLEKMRAFPLQYRTSSEGTTKIRFRLMLDNQESLSLFRAVDGGANEDKYNELMMRSTKGVESILKLGQLTDLGWFFSCSEDNEEFAPAGWVMFSGPKVLQLPVVSMMMPPPHPEIVTAGPPAGFFERNKDTLNPIIHSFLMKIGTGLDLIKIVSPEEGRDPLEAGRILQVMTDTNIISIVANRFDLGSFKIAEEALPYTATLLTMDSQTKGDFFDFQRRLLIRQKKTYGESHTITPADEERIEGLYNEALRRQAKALIAYQDHFKNPSIPLKLSGLTWIIGQRSPAGSFRALGTLIVNESGEGTQSHFDLEQSDPKNEPISRFFTGMLGRTLLDRG